MCLMGSHTFCFARLCRLENNFEHCNSCLIFLASNISTEAATKFMRATAVSSLFVMEKSGKSRSALECGVACFSDVSCAAFTFSVITGECYVYPTCARPVSQTGHTAADEHTNLYHYVQRRTDNLAIGEYSTNCQVGLTLSQYYHCGT